MLITDIARWAVTRMRSAARSIGVVAWVRRIAARVPQAFALGLVLAAHRLDQVGDVRLPDHVGIGRIPWRSWRKRLRSYS